MVVALGCCFTCFFISISLSSECYTGCSVLRPYPRGQRNIPCQMGQYYSCWWPGDLRRQAISSHDIDFMISACPWGWTSIILIVLMFKNYIRCKCIFLVEIIQYLRGQVASSEGSMCVLASYLRASSPRKLHRQASIYQRAHITKQQHVCGTPPEDTAPSSPWQPSDNESDPGRSPYVHVILSCDIVKRKGIDEEYVGLFHSKIASFMSRKQAIMCQNKAGISSVVPASRCFWLGSGTVWHSQADSSLVQTEIPIWFKLFKFTQWELSILERLSCLETGH